MKIRRNKKGFTIVELVIVIAVIGILTAILIPTFVNLTKKANKSSDQSLKANLNTALRMAETDNEVYKGHKLSNENVTMHDAVLDLRAYGYELNQLVTKADQALIWNSDTNQFELEKNQKGLNFWKIYNTPAQAATEKNISVYAREGDAWNNAVVNLSAVGFDAGYNQNIKTINYNHDYTISGLESKRHALVRTDGGTLVIDAEKDTLDHYGEGNVLNITAINSASYHEYGYFPKASIAQGRIVVEDSGEIPAFEITAVPTEEKPIIIETNNDVVVSATQEVVEELAEAGQDTLENVDIKVSDNDATITVDTVIDTNNIEVDGQPATEESLVSITRVKNITELKAAVAATSTAEYIMFANDITYHETTNSSVVNVLRSVIIDGNGFTLTGYGKRGTTTNYPSFALNHTGSNVIDVVFTNISIINDKNAGRPIEARGNINSITIKDSTVKATGSDNNQAITIGGSQATAAKVLVERSTIDANRSGYPFIAFNPFDLTIESSYIDGYCGVYFKGPNSSVGSSGSKVVANNTTFNSPNSYSLEGDNSFGVFAVQENVSNCKVTLNSCKVNSQQKGTAYQSLVSFGRGTNHQNNIFTINGEESLVNGSISTNAQIAPQSKIILNAGTYTLNPLSSDSVIGASITEIGEGKAVYETKDFTWIVK